MPWKRDFKKFFLFVTQTIVTHEEKKSCVHVVSIFRRELTSRLKARLWEIFKMSRKIFGLGSSATWALLIKTLSNPSLLIIKFSRQHMFTPTDICHNNKPPLEQIAIPLRTSQIHLSIILVWLGHGQCGSQSTFTHHTTYGIQSEPAVPLLSASIIIIIIVIFHIAKGGAGLSWQCRNTSGESSFLDFNSSIWV